MTIPAHWRIDPHTHSTFSDGTDTPAQIFAAAAKTGPGEPNLDVIGLVDHDTFAHYGPATQAWKQLREAGEPVPSVLLGMEISCQLATGPEAHLLAYLPRENGPALRSIVDRAQGARRERIEQMVALLAKDYPISWEDIVSRLSPGQTPGRPHVADALVRAGSFPDRSAAFAQVLHRGGGYYVPRWSPTPLEAIEATLADGGVPVLAHPFARRGAKHYLTESDIAAMKQAGLVGMEVWHRDHSERNVQRAAQVASRLALAPSGSSDFHGAGKPNRLGENLMPPQTLEQIIALGAHPFLATSA